MIKVGVIGYGYWGPNLVRNFMEAPGSTVVAVCDLRTERLAQLRIRYPTIQTVSDHQLLFTDPSVDAIVIATPVSSHFELAMAALRANKHVLIEKPLAANSEQGMQLIDEAARRQRVLMVDHTFVYTARRQKNSRADDRQCSRRHLLLRRGARKPGVVSARRKCDLGPRDS